MKENTYIELDTYRKEFDLKKKIQELENFNFDGKNITVAIIIPKDPARQQNNDACGLLHYITSRVMNSGTGAVVILEVGAELKERHDLVYDYVLIPHDHLEFNQGSLLERLKQKNSDLKII